MLRELPDRWIFGVRDSRVLRAEMHADVHRIELANEFLISTDAEVELADASMTDLAHAQATVVGDLAMLVGKEVASLVAFKSGVVRIVLRPGYHVVISPKGSEQTSIRQSGIFEWIGFRGNSEMAVVRDQE
ncbi:hypothetical protein [Kribbella sp. HUAS MG21]|uniref:AIM24 family protein n=1 Tax=Kribbella sp. HUAS MG21 TaxID=3160966 RepID=A0AAU7T5V1_9ACTN